MFRIFAALLFFFPTSDFVLIKYSRSCPPPRPVPPGQKRKLLETSLPVGCENRLTFFRHISCVKSLTLEAFMSYSEGF